MKQIFQLVTLFILCLITGCGIQTTQGGDGGATETVNAKVIISDSTVAVTIITNIDVSADVMIYDETYNPVTKTGFCDSVMGIQSDSEIVFSKLSGTYNIIINDHSSLKLTAFNGIRAGALKKDTLLDTLSSPGSIGGNVSFKTPSGIDKPSVSVYLRGTSFHTEADSLGMFQMQGIPDGEYFIKATIFYLKDIPGDKSVGKKIEIKSAMKTDSLSLFFSN
jgi:hypothetical protein